MAKLMFEHHFVSLKYGVPTLHIKTSEEIRLKKKVRERGVARVEVFVETNDSEKGDGKEKGPTTNTSDERGGGGRGVP